MLKLHANLFSPVRPLRFISPVSCPKDAPRVYNSLIISIITYSSDSWTLTKAQKKRLDVFNTKAIRRIVGVRWYDYVTNASILSRTGQPPLTTTIRKLRLSVFGHICRLQPGTQAIDILTSTPPSSWRRPRGHPPLRWADQIVKDTQLSLSDAVTATQDRPTWRSIVRDQARNQGGGGSDEPPFLRTPLPKIRTPPPHKLHNCISDI